MTTMKGLKNKVKREYNSLLRGFTETRDEKLERLSSRADAGERYLRFLRKRNDYIRSPAVMLEVSAIREQINDLGGRRRLEEIQVLKIKEHVIGGN
ncbi:MAG: hypothetical protein KGI06_05590 [Candidatus Micrarchaeota archaeon]|nr:hypothetical protein [Candidatus Micrarchaeota archaeon]